LPARQINKFSGAFLDYSMVTARSNYFYCADPSEEEEKRRPTLHNAFLSTSIRVKKAQQAGNSHTALDDKLIASSY